MFRRSVSALASFLNFGQIEGDIRAWYTAATSSARSSVPKFTETLRKAERQYHRRFARDRRHAGWPYCGARHRARIQRQIDCGQITKANGWVGDA